MFQNENVVGKINPHDMTVKPWLMVMLESNDCDLGSTSIYCSLGPYFSDSKPIWITLASISFLRGVSGKDHVSQMDWLLERIWQFHAERSSGIFTEFYIYPHLLQMIIIIKNVDSWSSAYVLYQWRHIFFLTDQCLFLTWFL